MFKNFLLGAALAAVMAGAALASNIPIVTTAQDPANELQLINQTIQAVNSGVSGVIAALPAAVVSSGTTIVALFTVTLPGGQLSAAGQGLHIHAWGTNSADANVKTITFAYGAATCAQIVTGSANAWQVDLFLVKTAAATQTYECHGQTATTLIASSQNTGTNTDASATTVTVSGTAATAGTVTLAGAYVEQIK